jgi:hypothetical protein
MDNEARTLAALMDQSHKAVLDVVERLVDQDLHRRFVVEGKELNSAFWILAHLTGSQNWLVLRGTQGPFRKYSWAKHFGMGSTGSAPPDSPTLQEVLATYVAVHTDAMAHVGALSEAQLSEPHQAQMMLKGGSDMRSVIKHHILHESGHCGQLHLLCALYGVPTL